LLFGSDETDGLTKAHAYLKICDELLYYGFPSNEAFDEYIGWAKVGSLGLFLDERASA
jgi:hypothetical protein